jgi:hypothetical protein
MLRYGKSWNFRISTFLRWNFNFGNFKQKMKISHPYRLQASVTDTLGNTSMLIPSESTPAKWMYRQPRPTVTAEYLWYGIIGGGLCWRYQQRRGYLQSAILARSRLKYLYSNKIVIGFIVRQIMKLLTCSINSIDKHPIRIRWVNLNSIFY